MKRAYQKLHSRSGASMLLALLFFFICLTVGAVVLTAASANAGRLRRGREEQQKYLAVESAALLIKEDMAALSFTGRHYYNDETMSDTYTVTNEDGTESVVTVYWHEYYYSLWKDADASLSGGSLAGYSELKAALGNLYLTTCPNEVKPPDFTPPASIRFPLDLEPLDTNVPRVTGTLSVAVTENLYTITVHLETTEGGAYPMTLVFRPVDHGTATTTGVGGNPVVTTYAQTITWEPPVISKGKEAPP